MYPVHSDLQVGADIRSSHKEAGFVKERAKRQNHEQNKVAELLKVLWYADLLEDHNDADTNGDGKELTVPQSGLMKSYKGWRKEMAKWVQEEQARSNNVDSDEEEQLQNITYGCQ